MKVYYATDDPEDDPPNQCPNAGTFTIAAQSPHPAYYTEQKNVDISGLLPGDYTFYIGKENADGVVEYKEFDFKVEGYQY